MKEVAQRQAVTAKTVRRWVREDLFDEVAIVHQRIRISPASYQRFLERHARRAAK